MSYGKLNIWIRDLNCCPKNVWKVELVVKTCGGEYEDACVNLIVPTKENCIRDVVIPVGIAARYMQLQPDKVRIATEVLMTTGQIQREALLKELTDLTRELKESKAEDAAKYVEAFEFTAKLVKGIRIEKEQK